MFSGRRSLPLSHWRCYCASSFWLKLFAEIWHLPRLKCESPWQCDAIESVTELLTEFVPSREFRCNWFRGNFGVAFGPHPARYSLKLPSSKNPFSSAVPASINLGPYGVGVGRNSTSRLTGSAQGRDAEEAETSFGTKLNH